MQPHSYASSTHASSSRPTVHNNLLALVQCHILYSRWLRIARTCDCHVFNVRLFVCGCENAALTPIHIFISPKMQYFSSGSLVSFYNRCPFQGGKQHLHPRLKTINILTKYNIIYSTFDTSNFNFSESEWLEI